MRFLLCGRGYHSCRCLRAEQRSKRAGLIMPLAISLAHVGDTKYAPATATRGNQRACGVPMGTRLRLKADFDIPVSVRHAGAAHRDARVRIGCGDVGAHLGIFGETGPGIPRRFSPAPASVIDDFDLIVLIGARAIQMVYGHPLRRAD